MAGPFHPLVEKWKTIAGVVAWSPPDPMDGYMGFSVPLDVDGVTVENFALRGGCYAEHPDKAVTFQLEIGHAGTRTRTPLIRVDWRPLNGGHKNPAKGPTEHRLRFIRGCHLHPFELNWLEEMQKMRTSNLPLALEISPPLQSFSELLEFVKNQFRINDVSVVPEPEWVYKLI